MCVNAVLEQFRMVGGFINGIRTLFCRAVIYRRQPQQNRIALAGIFIIGLFWLGQMAVPAQAADYTDLTSDIRKLLADQQLNKMRVGVRIESLGTPGALIYEQHSDELFKPASNQKLITTAAAMTVLPSNFTYRTILAKRGHCLVIIGAGDPSVGDPRLARAADEPITAIFHRWAEKLKAVGTTTIKGDLLFDDFIFDQQHVHPSWRQQQPNLQQWYTAPVGGLNFNNNCVDVVMNPGPEVGTPAEVTLIPATSWVQLKNTAVTASKGQPLVRRLGSGPITIEVSRSVSRGNSQEDPLSVAVVDPGAFFANSCCSALAARGITIEGSTRRQRVRLLDGGLPKDLEIIAVHEQRLSDILWRANKTSQNLFAEAFFKTIGAYVHGEKEPRTGSYETGREIIALFLGMLGVSANKYVLDDGSGLSHTNRATPAMLTKILVYMDTHPQREKWWASLAVPGEKVGTLRKRMEELNGRLFAKTGYINGVSALSGYVLGPGEQRYVFSIICNDTHRVKGGTGIAKRLQKGICGKLATWKP